MEPPKVKRTNKLSIGPSLFGVETEPPLGRRHSGMLRRNRGGTCVVARTIFVAIAFMGSCRGSESRRGTNAHRRSAEKQGFHDLPMDISALTSTEQMTEPAGTGQPSQLEVRYKDTFASFHAQGSSKERLYRRADNTPEDGLCLSLEFNAVNVSLEEEVIPEDPCAENFRDNSGENFCNDPYFGGLLGCCYANNTCFSCAQFGNCTEISLQCSSSYVQECSLSASPEILSDTFKSRQLTCAFAGETGYWRQPGYVFGGDFEFVRVANTDGVAACGVVCSETAGCTAFTWRPTDFACTMLSGEPEGLSLCPESGCVEAEAVYVLDVERMYCSPESLECACTREYHNCMSLNACGTSEEEARTVSDMCFSRNCSRQQCGLAPVLHGGGAAACGNEFLECKMEGRGACGCIKEYVECTRGFDDLRFDALDDDGWRFSELCATENCTAEQCGIPETVCNASSLACGADFVACLGQGEACRCVDAYLRCMERTNCIFDALKTELLDTCAIAGCEPDACGFARNEVLTLGCSHFSRMDCSREYLHCMQGGAECGCTRAKLECQVRWGCEITEGDLDQSVATCAENKCTARECGLCGVACNVTNLLCVSAYHACHADAPNATERCACASSLYECVSEGGCVTEAARTRHLELCAADHCTAEECGVTDAAICNQTDFACSDAFIACQQQRVNASEDRCALNYQPNRGLGQTFCTLSAFGGLPGCNYDPDDDACYTSGDCACSRDYYLCMRKNCVAESPALDEFTLLCAERGCTAAECGVEETEAARRCNLTSLTCANDFLACAYGSDDASPAAALTESEPGAPFCAQTFCLRYYFTCMKGGQCTSEADEVEHLKFCSTAGCSNAECGLLVEAEAELLPDMGGGQLVSRPALVVDAVWQPSDQAEVWAVQGSANRILRFEVVVESDCAGTQATTSCATLLLSASVGFYDLRTASFSGITPGTILKLTVRQRNVNGLGPVFVLTHRHVGVPSAPVDFDVERVGSLRVSAAWGIPLNTGDLSQNVVLDAYVLAVQPTPRSETAMLMLLPSELSTVLIHSVGGTFSTCAQEGEECVCSGLVRFGDGLVWSEPVRVRAPGRTLCAPGAEFPETRLVPSFGDARRCECSFDAVELVKGEQLSASVAADNFVGRSNFTAPDVVRVMGRPGPVASLEVVELEQSMLVSWSEPSDTGYGEDSAVSTSILEYTVYIAECREFMPRGCDPDIFIVPASQCEQDVCELEIPFDAEGALFPLVAGRSYYVTIVATNELAAGYLFFAPVFRRTWKIRPTIVSPTADNFPLRVAEFEGAAKIWLRSGQGVDSVVLAIDNFGRIRLDDVVTIDLIKGDDTRRVSMTLFDRQLTTEEADFNDPLGVEVRNFFVFVPPVFGTGGGAASGVMAGGNGFQLSLDLEYFEYPKPEVALLPTSGPLGGGNLAQVSFTEFIETQTRFAAGLPNFKSALASSIRIAFGERVATILSVLDPSLDTRTFVVEVPASDLGRNNEITLSYFIANTEMDVIPTTEYRYLGVGISSVVPNSGLTTGGTDITVLVEGVRGISISGTPVVTLAGVQAAVQWFAFAGADSESLQIDAITPAVPSPGDAPIEVSLSRPGLSPIVLNATGLYTFIAPPDPLIESVVVNGRPAGQRWGPTFVSSVVTIVVRFLFVDASERAGVTVQFGDYSASTPTSIVAQGDRSDARTAFSTIVVGTPVVSTPGFVNIAVQGVISGQNVSIMSPTSLQFEFRDVSEALVWATAPDESSTYGGALMTAGVFGFCKNMPQCPPGAFAVSFDFVSSGMVDASVYGSVTLESWLAKDSAYEALTQSAEVGAILEASGVETIARFEQVASAMEQFISENRDSGINATNAFMVLLMSPASPALQTSQAVSVSVSSGVYSASVAVDYIADPTVPATVEGVFPSMGQISSGIAVQVLLSDFALVYVPSDVTVKLMLASDGGDILARVLQVAESSSLRTRIEFELPEIPAPPGAYPIAVYPTRNVNNSGTFDFLFLGINLPFVEQFFPSRLYADGGVTITVIAGNYGSQTMVLEDLYVTLTQVIGLSIASRQTNPTAITVQGDLVTIEFVAPDFQVGSVTAQVVHRGSGDVVEIALEYITVPSGAPNVILDPTAGLSTGGELVQISLTNFRQISAVTDLIVTFGSTTLEASSIQRYQSTLLDTFVWVYTPSSPVGGEVAVTITSSANNLGSAVFSYTDVNQATLQFISPVQGDAGIEHLVDLTILNLGVTISDTIQLETNWDGVSGLTWDNNRKPIVESIVASDVTRVDLKLRIQVVPQLSGLTQNLAVTMYVGLVGDDPTAGLKTVSFVFTFLPRGATFVRTFNPASYYTDGGIPLTIQASNVPPEVTGGGVITVSFGQVMVGGQILYLPNTTLTSFTRTSGEDDRVEMETLLPAVSLQQTTSIAPRLVFAAPWSFVVDFPQQFEFVVPPNVRIVSMNPTTGPITAATIVTLELQYFPATAVNADIRVEFDSVAALVISFTRTDPTMDARRVQGISVQVETPCCTPAVIAGMTSVVAYHRSFPFRASTASNFEYFNPATPTVVAVLGVWGNLVRMSRPTEVTVILAMPATSESPIVTLNGENVLVTDVSFQTGVDRVSIFFEVSAHVTPGNAVGDIEFVSLGVTTTFTVRYYNDAIPFVLSFAPNVGPETGGTPVLIRLAHDISISIAEPSELVVRFGSELADVVQVQPVSSQETEIRVVTPPTAVSSTDGVRLVAMTIFEVDSQTTTPPVEFSFQDTVRRLASVQPTTGTTAGGDVVFVGIEYFPLRLLSRDIVVEFGTTTVHPDNITITSAVTDLTQLTLLTPRAIAGVVSVVISPRQDSAGSVTFQYEFVDPLTPVLVVPIPSDVCASEANVTDTVLVDNMDPLATVANTLVFFGGCRWAAPSDVSFSGSIAAISVEFPLVLDATTISVAVIYPTVQDNALPSNCPAGTALGPSVVTFPFEFQDCRVPRVLSVAPSSGVHIGGVMVTVRLALFPADVSILFANTAVPASDVEIIYSTEDELNLRFRTPFVFSVGLVQVQVSGFGSETVEVLEFSFQTVAPCDFESFCAEQGLVQNVQERVDNPPTSPVCDVTYCIAENLIPFPSITIVSPTEGPTTGSRVTMQVSAFPQLELDQNGQVVASSVAVEIIALNSVSRGQLTSLRFAGTNVLTSSATLIFDMPPRSAGPVTVVVQSAFGQSASTALVSRTVRFDFEYYAVIFGPAIVESVSPSQFPIASSPLLEVTLRNFPLVPAPFDLSLISFQADSQPPRTGAEVVESSTRSQTVVLLSVPEGYISCSETCNASLSVFYTSHGVARAGTARILLVADPDPMLEGVPLPSLILRTVPTEVDIRVAHFPLGLSANDIAVTALQGDLSIDLSIAQGPDYSSSSCTSVACSSLLIRVVVPADTRLVDDGATIRSCVLGVCVDAEVELYSLNRTVVRLVDPSTGLSTRATPVTVFLDNFPETVLSSEIQVRVGDADATGIVVQPGRTFERTVLLCDVQPPGNAGVLNGVVWGGTLNIADGAEFVFQFVFPLSSIQPIDGPTMSLTAVTVQFYWGIEAIQLSDVTVTLGGVVIARTAYLSGQEQLAPSDSQTPRTISFLTPSVASAGTVTGTVRLVDGRTPASFSFQYFNQPRIVDLQPRQATLEGWVGGASGNTIRVDVERFPDVISLSEFEVALEPLGCGDVSCQITAEIDSFVSSASLLSITIVVPAVQSSLPAVAILVRYTGSFTAQPGQDSNAVRSTRVADSRDVDILFRYVSQLPFVQQLQYCAACPSSPCVRGANCAGSDTSPTKVELAEDDPGPLEIRLPKSAAGSLTIKVRHFTHIREFTKASPSDLSMEAVVISTSESATLSVTINGVNANVNNVLWSSSTALLLECTPQGLLSSGQVSAVVTLTIDRVEGFQDARTARFSVRVIDPAVALECTAGCAGSVEGGVAATLVLSNFNAVVTDGTVLQRISILFGQNEATNMTVVSSTLSETVLRVYSPRCSACDFDRGRAAVDLTAQLRSTSSVFAVTSYSFVEAPKVSDVRFSQVGTSFQVVFDQPTDRGGLPQQGPCTGLLVDTAFGDGASCQWKNDELLVVKLGTNPTVIVGSLVTFLPGVLKSQDRLSPFFENTAELSFEIRGPSQPIKPGPMAIQGPQEVDGCSGASLRLMASSPRDWLNINWNCKVCGTNTALSLELKTRKTTMVELSASLLSPQGGQAFEYQISVQVTDFMRTRSDEVTHFVTKKNTPAPTASLLVYQLYYLDSEILIRGNMFFSNCAVPRALMSFSWSSDTIADSILDGNSPQLLIPAHTLTADTTYTLRFRAQFDYDATLRTQTTVSFHVGQSAIVADIEGGSELEVADAKSMTLSGSGSRDLSVLSSVDQGLTFEWTCLFESDPCRDTDQNLLPTQTLSSFTLAPGRLFAAATYIFRLIVRKGLSRRASRSVRVFVSGDSIPSVGIRHGLFRSTPVSGLLRVNSLRRLVLTASTDDNPTSFAWSMDPPMLTDAQSALPMGLRHRQLLFRPGRGSELFIGGFVYTVTLVGRNRNGREGRATLQVEINLPPEGGTCALCVSGASNCQNEGVALQDTFRMVCANWADADQPLSYRFGVKFRRNRIQWMNLLDLPERDFSLPRGRLQVYVEVVDSLGAASDVIEQEAVVSAFSGRRSVRGLLQDEPANIAAHLATLEEDVKRAFIEAVFSGVASVAAELDSLEMDDASRYNYTLATLQLVSSGLARVAETMGQFQEAAVAAGLVMQTPCRAEAGAVLAALDIMTTISNLKASFPATTEGFAQNLMDVFASSLASSSTSACGDLQKISGQDATNWMRRTRSIVNVVLQSLISEYIEGEDAAEILSTFANHSAFTSSLQNETGMLAIGSAASFSLPAADGSRQFDILRGDEILPDFVEEFGTTMLGTLFASLSIFEGGTAVTTPGTFKIVIPLDEARSTARSGKAWTQRANCNFFDEATGLMKYDGCRPVDTQPTFVECECNHLTTFSAGLDPNLTYCGDGDIAGAERCDDANEVSSDGCSAQCVVEDGAVCVGSGADGSGPSRCCAACPGGFERIGCDPRPPPNGQLTNCTQCPEGTFRSPGGNYDDRCQVCNTREKQIPNEEQSACIFDPLSCGDGEQDYWEQCDDGGRQDGDGCNSTCQIESGAICGLNLTSNLSVCCAQCPGGFGRSQACNPPLVLTECFVCPPGTFRGAGGFHSDGCQACADATYSAGAAVSCTDWPQCRAGEENVDGNNTQPGQCRPCPVGFWARALFFNLVASHAQECVPHSSCPMGEELAGQSNSTPGTCEPCPTSGYKDREGNSTTMCVPCPVGLFAASPGASAESDCSLFLCGDGARSAGDEACDDGNLIGDDGCSSTCVVEPGFACIDNEVGFSQCSCAPDYYNNASGRNCSVFCSSNVTCSGHGSCLSSGEQCVCTRLWLGSFCNFQFPAEETYQQAVTNINVVNTLLFGAVTLSIPANALSEQVTVSADLARDLSAFPASILPTDNDDLVLLDGIVDLRPEGTTFDPAATFTYALPSPLGDPRLDPLIATFDFSQQRWIRLASSYDAGANAVSTQLSHFSLYAPASPRPTGTLPPTTTPTDRQTTTTTASDTTTLPVVPVTTPAPPADTTPAPTDPGIVARSEGGLSSGELAAVIVGPVLFVLACVIVFLYCKRRQPEPRDDTVPLVPPLESPREEPAEQPAAPPEEPLVPPRRESRELELPEVEQEAEPAEVIDASEHASSIPPDTYDDDDLLQVRQRADDGSGALTRAAPASVTPLVWDQSPAPGLWTMCGRCENPVKSVWPRCPKCKEPIEQESADQPLLPPSEQARVQQRVDLVRVQGQFDLECSNCHAPVKSSWPRCPSCKTDTASAVAVRSEHTPLPQTPQVTAELELAGTPLDRSLVTADLVAQTIDQVTRQAGFDGACPSCNAPVKTSWPRCPNCKTKIDKPAQAMDVPELAAASPARSGSGAVTADIVSAGTPAPSSGGVPQLVPLPGDDQPLPAILQGMGEPCRMCGGPMKERWDKCPTCKFPARPLADSPAAPSAPASSGRAGAAAAVEKHRKDLGFDHLCTKCQGPVKPTWPRCPTCKTPIAKPKPDLASDLESPRAAAAAPAMPAMPGQPDEPHTPPQQDRSVSGLFGSVTPGQPDGQTRTPPQRMYAPSAEPAQPPSPAVSNLMAGDVEMSQEPAPDVTTPEQARPAMIRVQPAEPSPRSPEPPRPAVVRVSQPPSTPAPEPETTPLVEQVSPVPDPEHEATEAWPPGQATPSPEPVPIVAPASAPVVKTDLAPAASSSARVVWAGPPRQPPPIDVNQPPAPPSPSSEAPPSAISGLQAASPAPSRPPPSTTSEQAPSLISGLQASSPAPSNAASLISGLQAASPAPSRPPASVASEQAPSVASGLQQHSPPPSAREPAGAPRASLDAPSEEGEGAA